MSDDERSRAFAAITALRENADAEASRTLVEFLEAADDSVSLEAARVLDDRDVPDDLRDRVAAGLLAGDRMNTWAAGARALVGHSRAVELAEPILRIDVVSTAEARNRARYVLAAIEDQLARRTRDERVPLPDPRFRTLAAEVVRLDPDADYGIENAYRFFDGEDVTPPWHRVHFLPEDVLPLLVAGIRLHDDQIPDVPPGLPPGLTVIDHQYGGYSCNQATVFGYVLRLPLGAAMRTEIEALSNELYGSYGEHMSPTDLVAWNARLAPLFEGALTQGSEGLLIADGTRPAALHGLDLLRFGSQFAPWRWGVDAETARDIVDGGPYGVEHERALTSLGTPYTAVIMETCD